MRIGMIADIHGNLTALDAVLADVQRVGYDQLLCLGDLSALGPQPNEVIDRLQSLGCPCVLGNTDAWLVPNPALTAEPATTPPVQDLTHWCMDQLTEDALAYLQALPLSYRIDLPGDRALLAFHATPQSLDEVISATTPSEVLHDQFADDTADVVVYGHTHIPLLRRFAQAQLINPGSVGLPGTGPGTPDLPVNRGVQWAAYSLLDIDERTITVTFRQVPLDLDAMRHDAATSGMPWSDWWCGLWG